MRFLKAGYIESGLLKEAKRGTPQGGNLSPLLANIFLHYVLDEWFEKELEPTLVGQCYLVRYCDDFVILTQYQQEAKTVMTRLQERFEAYGLELNTEKLGVISFGRYERENAEKQLRRSNTFDFLGFTHYCALTRKGKFKVSRRTSAERFRKSLREIYLWLKAFKNTINIEELWIQLVSKLRGHSQYYGVSENFRRLQEFYHHIEDMAFKLLNRRCDKKSFNWRGFCKYLHGFHYPSRT